MIIGFFVDNNGMFVCRINIADNINKTTLINLALRRKQVEQ